MLLMEILIQDLMKFLVVTGPTHLNGGLLDHAYLLKSFPRMNVVKLRQQNCKYWPKEMMKLTLKEDVNTAAKHNVLLGIMYICDITL